MKYFARAGGLLSFSDVIQKLGSNPAKLLSDAGLNNAALQDPDHYVSYIKIAQLLCHASKVCNQPNFGLFLGRQQGLEITGALSSILCLQPNLLQAFVVLQKNLGFHARGLNLLSEPGANTINLYMSFDFTDETDCSQLIALSLAVFSRCVDQLHDKFVPTVEVSLTYSAPSNSEDYERFFSCPVLFDQPYNRLSYPHSLLSQPLVIDQNLRNELTSRWRGDWQKALPASLSEQVDRAILAILPTGDYSVETVAELLAMHPRTLQKNLKAEEKQFGEILQSVRKRLALQHLENSDIDLTNLALELGFSELSVFSRAFKKWFGVSPREWRKTNSLVMNRKHYP